MVYERLTISIQGQLKLSITTVSGTQFKR